MQYTRTCRSKSSQLDSVAIDEIPRKRAVLSGRNAVNNRFRVRGENLDCFAIKMRTCRPIHRNELVCEWDSDNATGLLTTNLVA
ncbi:hypothetical protein CEE69_25000 [Rhodopirellula bahusiensis]|uniref:Uncharacterized protein n=1 Tax=Rhodopirellula bahusiensis TaxID=2014065 RepID=A0A2G1W0J1_9BACT|nr:hypothetical protein CEE69_25000 [Rhodopirellula bahusiensis]